MIWGIIGQTRAAISHQAEELRSRYTDEYHAGRLTPGQYAESMAAVDWCEWRELHALDAHDVWEVDALDRLYEEKGW